MSPAICFSLICVGKRFLCEVKTLLLHCSNFLWASLLWLKGALFLVILYQLLGKKVVKDLSFRMFLIQKGGAQQKVYKINFPSPLLPFNILCWFALPAASCHVSFWVCVQVFNILAAVCCNWFSITVHEANCAQCVQSQGYSNWFILDSLFIFFCWI